MRAAAREACVRLLAATGAALALAFSAASEAHHGFGLFDRSREVTFTGVITDIDFVNPVDTIGFAPGVLAPPVRHSDRLHVVERFSLDPETMALRRDYLAEDPVYFTDQYVGYDVVLPADVPYEPHPCDELAPEFVQGTAGE